MNARDIIAKDYGRDADDCLAALREAANAEPADTITIGPDGTVGRLEREMLLYDRQDPRHYYNKWLYRVVTPVEPDPNAPTVCPHCNGAGPRWLNADDTHGCHACSGSTDSAAVSKWYGREVTP